MAKTTARAKTVTVQCDGCDSWFAMPAAEHAQHLAERDAWTCPNGCSRQFLAPNRTHDALTSDAVRQGLRVDLMARQLNVALQHATSSFGTSPARADLERAEEVLARIARELAELGRALRLELTEQ